MRMNLVVFSARCGLRVNNFSRSLALSILSMLSSAKEKRLPEDNATRESA